VVKSLENETETGYGGASSFVRVAGDFRFVETFANVGLVLAIWLPVMLLVVVVLALLIDSSPGRFGAAIAVPVLPARRAGRDRQLHALAVPAQPGAEPGGLPLARLRVHHPG